MLIGCALNEFGVNVEDVDISLICDTEYSESNTWLVNVLKSGDDACMCMLGDELVILGDEYEV